MAYNCVIVTGVTVSDYFCICMPTLSENEYKFGDIFLKPKFIFQS